MSKKHKKSQTSEVSPVVALSHSEEYRLIKHDLIKVGLLNAVYLAAVLALYYSNVKSGYLEHWFDRLLHF